MIVLFLASRCQSNFIDMTTYNEMNQTILKIITQDGTNANTS